MAAQNTMPERVGPYRLLEKIGEGGMGVVHLAQDPQGRSVAIKVLRPAVAGDPDARRRLGREFETMRRVRSPFVAAVIDADVTGDMPYVVTRYVAGPSLDQLVSATGPLRGQALERLAWGLAEGLAAVHAAGVVHRDLKPGNVVIAGGAPVVIDFGIAHAPDATRITQAGMFMGTPGYLAPEIVEGQPSGPSADVHAWGSTVAFAATGRAPFGTGSYETIFYRIVSGRPDLAGIPGRLLPMVTAALARDPVSRPSAVQLSTECAALDLSGPDAGDLPAPGAALSNAGTLLGQPAAQVRHWTAQMEVAPGGANHADLLPPVQYAPVNGASVAVPQPQGGTRLRGVLSLITMGIAVALSVLLPVAGTVVSLLLVVALRAADLSHSGLTRRRSAQGARASDVPLMIIKTPWSVVRALVGCLILAPLALTCAAVAACATVLAMSGNPLPAAGAAAAGAFIGCYGLGPGSATPRRQLGRLFGALARKRPSAAITVTVLVVLLVAAVAAAATQPHHLWPVTSSLAQRLQSVHNLIQRVQFRLQHL